MAGAIELALTSGDGGIPAHSYSNVVGQLTRALEEIDRVTDPSMTARPFWNVTDTSWREGVGPLVTLTPSMKNKATRSSEELARPALALWAGLSSLSRGPEIPPTFSASIVDRVVRVRNQVHHDGAGLRGVAVAPLGLSVQPAVFDDTMGNNASAAVKIASLAYGSLVGRLDLISARGRGTRIGLRVENGPPVMCDVDQIDKAVYMDAFESRVLVAGLLKRNASGQAIRMHVDHLEVAPAAHPVSVAQLLGALPDIGQGLSAVEYVRTQRAEQ